MGKINTGGPAFPFVQWRSPDGMIHSDLSAGMTLRDWFAGQALQGALSHLVGVKDAGPEGYAKRSYEYADAMLYERSKGGSDA